MKPELLWHYTYGASLPGLAATQMINLTERNGPIDDRAVWFSKDQFWERTVRKGKPNGDLMRFAELIKIFGAYRIGVMPETAPVSFKSLKSIQTNVPWHVAEQLGIEWGAKPDDWFVSLIPVASKDWKAVEVYTHGAWTGLELSTANALKALREKRKAIKRFYRGV